MNSENALLQPAVALLAWSMLIWLWMYATRIPAIVQSGMQMDPNAVNGAQMAQLPAKVRWKADNYNHLMEQPTLFYAVIAVLVLSGDSSGLSVILAWAYVGMRVAHSLLQVLLNKIEVRFGLFVLSSLLLIGLITRAAICVF
ncbi:MAG: MAPEG family protein [Oceanococcus sp.]